MLHHILTMISFVNLLGSVLCLPGHHAIDDREHSTTTTVIPNTLLTPRLAVPGHDKKDIDILSATCDSTDDICSIWEVSSTVFTVITGPNYTPTTSSGIPFTTGGTSNSSISQISNPPFANSTSTSKNFTSLPSGTISMQSGGSNSSKTTSDSNRTPADATTSFSATIGPISTGGSAVSSGFLPSSSRVGGGIWTNSSSSIGTGMWPGNGSNSTKTQPGITISYWGPWTAWTSNTPVNSTETSQEPAATSSYSESEFASYTTTYVFNFSDTSYVIPIPVSYTFFHHSTDTGLVSEALSTTRAIPLDTSQRASQTVSTKMPPVSRSSVSIRARPTSMSFNPAATPADTSAVSSTNYSSCFTTTPMNQLVTPTMSPTPTVVCWGFSCTNSTCSDWLTSYAVAASNATTTGAPYANSTSGQNTGPRGTGVYPTGSVATVNPAATTVTEYVGTVTETVYQASGPNSDAGWGPWIDWTSTFSTSTMTVSANNTNTTSTHSRGSIATVSRPLSTGTKVFVQPLSVEEHGNENVPQHQSMRSPVYLRYLLKRRTVAAKNAYREDTQHDAD